MPLQLASIIAEPRHLRDIILRCNRNLTALNSNPARTIYRVIEVFLLPSKNMVLLQTALRFVLSPIAATAISPLFQPHQQAPSHSHLATTLIVSGCNLVERQALNTRDTGTDNTRQEAQEQRGDNNIMVISIAVGQNKARVGLPPSPSRSVLVWVGLRRRKKDGKKARATDHSLFLFPLSSPSPYYSPGGPLQSQIQQGWSDSLNCPYSLAFSWLSLLTKSRLQGILWLGNTILANLMPFGPKGDWKKKGRPGTDDST